MRRQPAVFALAVLVAVIGPLALAGPSSADHANPPGPTAAYNTFGWWSGGSLRWREEFHGRLSSQDWKVEGPGLVRNQHGMLTLNTSTSGSVIATLNREGHSTGRWEMRIRSKRYGTSATDYRVRTELVPVGEAEYCGARNIALTDYELGTDQANFYVRNLPAKAWRSHTTMNLGNNVWHTFGVEVTERRVTWFVDAHALATERRPAALSGVPLTIRFTMVAPEGASMNRSRMQMDWVRSWGPTRGRDPRNEIDTAPSGKRGTYRDSCVFEDVRWRAITKDVRTIMARVSRTIDVLP